MAAALALGFKEPVFDAQRAFRAVLDALARPGSIQPFGVSLAPPPGLPAGLAILALTLADHEAPLWLDAPLAADPAIAAWLRFHTGAPIVSNPAEAAFALIADPENCPPFTDFAQGTPEYPDRSTTLVFAADDLQSGAPLTFAGPGIETQARFAVTPRPADLPARIAANGTLFPCGVDLLFATADAVVGLPRTTRIVGEG